MDGTSNQPLVVRSYRPCDAAACRRLFVEGLINGLAADAGDPGADIDAIDVHYLNRNGSHFWVVELTEDEGGVLSAGESGDGAAGGAATGYPAGTVVGMIGVQRHDDGTAEIRRLRVDGRFRRRGIGSLLVEQALRFCHDHHYLRVILDTYMERDPAVSLFQKFHFQHGRTRPGKRQERLYFYLDLYGCGQPEAGN